MTPHNINSSGAVVFSPNNTPAIVEGEEWLFCSPVSGENRNSLSNCIAGSTTEKCDDNFNFGVTCQTSRFSIMAMLI